MQYNFPSDPKFWTGLIDVVASLVLYFVGKYGAPDLLDDIKFVILALQPVAVVFLLGFFQADQAALLEGVRPAFLARRKGG